MNDITVKLYTALGGLERLRDGQTGGVKVLPEPKGNYTFEIFVPLKYVDSYGEDGYMRLK